MQNYLQKYFYFIRGNKKGMVLLVCLFLFASFLDLLSIGLIAPFISLITSPIAMETNEFLKAYNSFFEFNDTRTSITLLGLIIVLLFYFKGVASYWVQKRIVKFAMNIQSELVSQLMNAYQGMSYYFHIKRNSASLIQTITIHIANFSHHTLIASLRFISEIFVIFLILGLLAFKNVYVMMTATIILVVVYLIYDKVVKHLIRSAGEKSSESNEGIIKGVTQGISGLKEIRIFGREQYFHNKVKECAIEYANVSSQYQALKVIPRYLFETTIVTLIITFTIILFLQNNELTSYFPILGLFSVAAMRLIPSANQISAAVTSMRFSAFSLKKLFDDLNEIDEMRLNSQIMENNNELENKRNNISKSKFSIIEIKKISYRYPDTDIDALTDISICIKRGQSIGLIGQSGSGKTTLVNVLLGLLTAKTGRIEVDGMSINNNLRNWMNMVSYIPQDGFIIDDTIKRNIALGVLDEEIDENKLKQSLQIVQLKDFVEALPSGVNTDVGERGIMMSGGQRQRLALARAFYHEREIIIMDEATAALDNKTEKQLVEAINDFKEEKTMIVIAHRLSTVKDCDVIYKLDKGRIIDYGKPDRLCEVQTTS
jgi:ATP-binding cassette, subfamily B, bacterial PglK